MSDGTMVIFRLISSTAKFIKPKTGGGIMKRKILICLAVVVLLVGGIGLYVSAGDVGQCMADCAAEQGICMGQCQGDGQCINRCAEAHGRCVSRCH